MASWFLGSTEAPSSMEATMDDLVKRLRERDIAAWSDAYRTARA